MIILLGCIFSLVYWILESALDSLLFINLHHRTFFESLLPSSDADEIWMRFLVISLIIAFSLISQHLINKYAKLCGEFSKKEEELRSSSEFLENVTQGIQEGILLLSTDFKILWSNKAMVEKSGYAAEDIIGKNCYKVTHQQDVPCEHPIHTCPIHQLQETGKPSSVLHTHFDKDGKKMFVEVTVYPLKNKDGKIIQYIHVSRDITERKRLENLKDEFLSTISHELRTPLSITKEGIEVVLDGTLGQINEEQREILSSAKNNINRLTRIVDSILDISKIEAGKLILKKEIINIVDLIKHLVSSFELTAKEKELEIRTNFSNKSINVYVDADKISQVFINLIGNSIKFTKKGFIEITAREDEKFVECCVKDTGIGISNRDMPKLFQKFQQFARLPGGGEKGTGLGLVIAKEIIEMHEGNVWAESVLDKGTKFTFKIPKHALQS